NPARGLERLVGEDAERRSCRERLERLGNARIDAGELQEAAIVEREKALEGRRRRRKARGGKYTRDEHRRPLADHAADGLLGKRRTPLFHEQGVGRLGEIAPRVDEGAVEIEDNKGHASCLYSANDVGVSQTVTRRTGRR